MKNPILTTLATIALALFAIGIIWAGLDACCSRYCP